VVRGGLSSIVREVAMYTFDIIGFLYRSDVRAVKVRRRQDTRGQGMVD